mgnify:CR=1 FL=1
MCQYSKPVPGDCHISCIRKFDPGRDKKQSREICKFLPILF